MYMIFTSWAETLAELHMPMYDLIQVISEHWMVRRECRHIQRPREYIFPSNELIRLHNAIDQLHNKINKIDPDYVLKE